MLHELMFFAFIVLVFIFAYGVSTQSLMYHNQQLNIDLFKNIFFGAYFVIGGEYFEREKLMEVDQCVPQNQDYTLTDQYSQEDCPEPYGAKVSLGLLVGYLMLLNILLVNLLIAIFSNTYSEIESEADKIWMLQRYSLVREYFYRPFLATPFTIFYYVFELIYLTLSFLIGILFKLSPNKPRRVGRRSFFLFTFFLAFEIKIIFFKIRYF